MAGAQNKKNSPGAYKSSLIPYKEQIFAWWFDERLSGVEIQERLKEQFNIEIHSTSITRFIRVRRLKPDPRERPPRLPRLETNPISQKPAIPKTAPNYAEAEKLLQTLKESTPQELGRAADKAREEERERKKAERKAALKRKS